MVNYIYDTITITFQKSTNCFRYNKKRQNIKKKILEFQNFIKENFENVGDDFAYKARSLHYNNKKKQKGIYGNASRKQIKELQEEGIETETFPWIEDKNN